MPPGSPINLNKFTFDVRRDTIDFRDKMYEPTLVDVPPRIDLESYKSQYVPILNQGNEGACTGFGLATVVHFLLRTRKEEPNDDPVSPRMLYEMAKRYDEWPGEKYSGSSARGAMKGWHKHGVCSDKIWPYMAGQADRILTNVRAIEARNRPLGAYFRVNHKDLVAMHSAIAEVKILYATANVHEGWNQVDDNGWIPFRPAFKMLGGHAFAIVAYDREGFWVQNSWSSAWGIDGYAKILYDDWLANGMDVWVARLGVPITRLNEDSTAATRAPGAERAIAYTYSDLRPHIISLENDGKLREWGTYGADAKSIEKTILEDIPRITDDWDKKRIFLYAHGGLVGETGFIQRMAEYRSAFLKVNVFPLAFVWHTDLWTTVTNILKDAVKQRRPEGILDDALDFMLDRLDDTIEAIVRSLRVKGLWDEMKENAHLATVHPEGGARLTLKFLAELMEKEPNVEIHVAGHSAGSIFHAYLLQYLTTKGKISAGPLKGIVGLGQKVASCTLWAPGIRIQEFKDTYLPSIKNGKIERFSLYTLKDDAEQDDHCGNVYHKSLLYLVSNALESKIEEEILGMEKFVKKDQDLDALFKSENVQWIKSPNNSRLRGASKASHHGDFDDDKPTLMSTLVTILNSEEGVKSDLFDFKRSSSSLGDRRRQLG
jgi:hypothetical protein